jgi:hypothetical protein
MQFDGSALALQRIVHPCCISGCSPHLAQGLQNGVCGRVARRRAGLTRKFLEDPTSRPLTFMALVTPLPVNVRMPESKTNLTTLGL